MIRPKQLARLGEFHIEEAILDVLLEARHEEQCMRPAEISRESGIFRKSGDGTRGAPSGMNDAIVTGFLIKLIHNRQVQRCGEEGQRGYELTDEEFEKRRDDS